MSIIILQSKKKHFRCPSVDQSVTRVIHRKLGLEVCWSTVGRSDDLYQHELRHELQLRELSVRSVPARVGCFHENGTADFYWYHPRHLEVIPP